MELEVREKRLRPLVGAPEGSLVLHEIYASIQGESTYAGLPCTFVRTTACHLRCRWCDTPHAFTEGRPWSMTEILREVERLGLPLVEITGGEPLLQPKVLDLMRQLCDRGYQVLLETSGALDVRPVDARVVKIVDLKAPGSGEEGSNLYENMQHLSSRDEVKIVLADRADYEWAKAQMVRFGLTSRATVLFSTVFGRLEPKTLATWIVEDKLPVRFQLQQHKYVWDPKTRGV
jgi:7-carboxy-7-deazaguanine synthase